MRHQPLVVVAHQLNTAAIVFEPHLSELRPWTMRHQAAAGLVRPTAAAIAAVAATAAIAICTALACGLLAAAAAAAGAAAVAGAAGRCVVVAS